MPATKKVAVKTLKAGDVILNPDGSTSEICKIDKPYKVCRGEIRWIRDAIITDIVDGKTWVMWYTTETVNLVTK